MTLLVHARIIEVALASQPSLSTKRKKKDLDARILWKDSSVVLSAGSEKREEKKEKGKRNWRNVVHIQAVERLRH